MLAFDGCFHPSAADWSSPRFIQWAFVFSPNTVALIWTLEIPTSGQLHTLSYIRLLPTRTSFVTLTSFITVSLLRGVAIVLVNIHVDDFNPH